MTDSYTWSDYATAEACVSTNPNLTLGFVLTDSPFSCTDLDTYKTTDASIIAMHKEIFESIDSYGELSPQNGVHIWAIAKLPEGKKLTKQCVEIYTTGRYMTVTKRALNENRIEQRQQQMNELYYRMTDLQKKQNRFVPDDTAPTQVNDDVISAAANAVNGELFKQLYLGNWQSMYPSQSEADQAFVDIVAFYTDSRIQVEQIFHQSALGKRKKAMRRDYMFHEKYGIITRAFDQKKPNIRFENIENIIKNKVNEEARKAIIVPVQDKVDNGNGFHSKLKKLPDFIKDDVLHFDFELPPGLVGETARFIFRNAVHPVKEVATGAAIALMAGICGRAFNISNTGLNHYVVILAQTGGGKEGAASGIERLCSYVREKQPLIDQFLGPAEIASPQALIKQLAETPCFMTHKGEMGFWMQKLTSKYAK